MSLQAEKSLVANIDLSGVGGGSIYYVTDRYGITLDSQAYSNIVTAWGRASYEGNIGDGFRVGSFSMTLINGEEMVDNGYLLDPTVPWNNQTVTVKKWTSGITTFAGCADFVKGIIKNFSMSANSISFDIDVADNNDDILLPSIVCEDQSGLTAEADYRAKRTGSGGLGVNQIRVDNVSIFDDNEFVRIYNATGGYEYNQIDNISNDLITFKNLLINSYITSDCYVEKPFRNLPSESVGKTIPIQVGVLDDYNNGVFGKAVTINNSIGNQAIVVDSIKMNTCDGIGTWDNGLKRFFIGNGGSQSVSTDYEYEINSNKMDVAFRVDSTTTLNSDILSTADEVTDIVVGDYTQLTWSDEDTVTDSDTYPELLSTNIIAIGNELMMIVEKPTSNTIWVERGYNSSEITTHSSGDKIYQSAKYSSKNLLSFIERFNATAAANLYVKEDDVNLGGSVQYTDVHETILDDNKISNMFDDSLSTKCLIENYVELDSQQNSRARAVHTYDIKFENTEDSFTVVNAYMGFKYKVNTNNHDGTWSGLSEATLAFAFFDPASSSRFDDDYPYSRNLGIDTLIAINGSPSPNSNEVNGWDSLDKTDTGPGGQNYNLIRQVAPYASYPTITFTDTKDLNKKWKIAYSFFHDNSSDSNAKTVYFYIEMYKAALWVEFFMNFAKRQTFAPVEGRLITADTDTITGATAGDLMQNPVEAIAQILTQELGYETTDFNTTNWTAVRTYLEDTSKYPVAVSPRIAFSYGYEDKRQKGWALCEEIASHFNLSIFKDYDGTINIVNLHEVYYDTPSGSEIAIEDILFLPQNGNRRLTVRQTGTDLIYNDINVKWKRNNSSNEYQQVYKIPDDFSTYWSGNSLRSIRETYYGGKRRAIEIESPYIYNEYDAIRKAKWEMDDKSEAHFWVEFFLDFDHYSENQSPPLSTQYHIGDIIYLTGTSHGVRFTSDNKFYIQNIYFSDSGREIEIHAKSLQNIVDFQTTATTGEKVIFDTGGTSLTGDDIWNDTGGTSLTGDDIINDTGGV